MKLNHINLPVADVAATQAFFATYFGMTTVMERGQNMLAIMRDDAGLILNLSNFSKGSEIVYHKDFHVGFFVDTREEVEQVHARMIGDGLVADVPKRMAGRFSFYINAPGGFILEVAHLEGDDW